MTTGAETEAIWPQTKKKECPPSSESGKSRGNFSPRVAEQGWPSYQHFDFRILTSKSVKITFYCLKAACCSKFSQQF